MNPLLRNLRILIVVTAGCVLFADCIEAYVSPYKSPPTGYLVVDGYISGNGPTQYTLSRSTSLSGDSVVPAVTGARLQVEGTDNVVFPLPEKGKGVYGIDSLPLNTGQRYRLRIVTPDGDTCLSDFVPYKPTPPIDSVNWIQRPDGVTIYVSTHDPGNSTRYYQWVFDQTYEYHSAEASGFIYVPSTRTLVARTDSQQNFTCWKDVPPTRIVVGSSAKLAGDVIYEFPLVQIPANTQPLSVEYSIDVQQYSLTDSAYNFLSLMQRSTENLGSVFDAQPTQLTGNIHSLSHPGEEVIGFISAGTMQEERIFISRDQVKDWTYVFQCADPDKIVANDPDSFALYYGGFGLVPLYQNFGPAHPLFGFYSNNAGCVDCTASGGGTTVKPAFWPF
ncbi:MAG TPA: DUF4249 domain-containing protein [Puia sp.]|nr:DUF4249 domain-containing protein [Puia sp.]